MRRGKWRLWGSGGGFDQFFGRRLVPAALDIVFRLDRIQRASGTVTRNPLVILGLADDSEVLRAAERLVRTAGRVDALENEFLGRVPWAIRRNGHHDAPSDTERTGQRDREGSPFHSLLRRRVIAAWQKPAVLYCCNPSRVILRGVGSVQKEQQPVERVIITGHRLLRKRVPEFELRFRVTVPQLRRQRPINACRLAADQKREQ